MISLMVSRGRKKEVWRSSVASCLIYTARSARPSFIQKILFTQFIQKLVDHLSKTSQECETGLTSQYWTLFLILVFFVFFCLFVFFVFLSTHHSDQMCEGSEVSKVTLYVKILKWHSPSQWVSEWVTKVRYRAARAAKDTVSYIWKPPISWM